MGNYANIKVKTYFTNDDLGPTDNTNTASRQPHGSRLESYIPSFMKIGSIYTKTKVIYMKLIL